MIKILDKGYVELISSYGDDLTIVNGARVSFNKHSSVMTEADAGLINYLMKNKHGTPFEMVDFTFRIKCPIFVAREWFRHRMASYNEMSGRYVELEKEFYVPDIENIRMQKGKPGNYYYEPLAHHVSGIAINSITDAYDKAWAAYQELLDCGVAREQARMVLPVGIYTQFFFKLNLRSLLNFLSLRNEETAQWEIQQYAKAIEELVKEIVPVTMKSFENNDRICP